jgi:hypothetical protein
MEMQILQDPNNLRGCINTNVPLAHLRFIVLTIAERTLIIYIEAPKDEFEGFMNKAEQVFQTIEFMNK